MRHAEMTSLSLQSTDAREPARSQGRGLLVFLAILIAGMAGLGFIGYRILQRTASVEQQVASLSNASQESADLARQALDRAAAAEESARAAAEGREVAET